MAWQKGQRMATEGAPRGGSRRLFSTTDEQTLRLTVNGKPQTAPPGTTVAGLLALMGVDPGRVAVERNEDVVPRKTWAEALLGEGDQIEIVAFIGGGSGGGSAAAA